MTFPIQWVHLIRPQTCLWAPFPRFGDCISSPVCGAAGPLPPSLGPGAHRAAPGHCFSHLSFLLTFLLYCSTAPFPSFQGLAQSFLPPSFGLAVCIFLTILVSLPLLLSSGKIL